MKIINLNIGNPSIERAHAQVEWLFLSDKYDIIVLTETRKSVGCELIITKLKDNNYKIYTDDSSQDYGVIIAVKVEGISFDFLDENTPLRSRSSGVKISVNNNIINVVGIYVPSNDKRKNLRKKPFMEAVIKSLSKFRSTDKVLLCGDFNTVMRTHIPKYSMFRKWEYEFFDEIEKIGLEDVYDILYPNQQVYSWFGKTGNSYKYDYNFITKNLKKNLKDVVYLNETIELKLTDHAATVVELDV